METPLNVTPSVNLATSEREPTRLEMNWARDMLVRFGGVSGIVEAAERNDEFNATGIKAPGFFAAHKGMPFVEKGRARASQTLQRIREKAAVLVARQVELRTK